MRGLGFKNPARAFYAAAMTFNSRTLAVVSNNEGVPSIGNRPRATSWSPCLWVLTAMDSSIAATCWIMIEHLLAQPFMAKDPEKGRCGR